MPQDPHRTQLSPSEEIQFQDWYKKISQQKRLAVSPDASEQYYDYRGFWKEGLTTPSGDDHFTDKFKQPGHPTFSDESQYSNDKTKGGKWTRDANNEWYFNHSDYTGQYNDRTKEYLKGTGEHSIYKGDTTKNYTKEQLYIKVANTF